MRWKRYAALLALGLLGTLIWYVLRPIDTSLPAAQGQPSALESPSAPVEPTAPAPSTTTAASSPKTAPAKEGVTLTTPPWEMKIDELLRSQADHNTIAKLLLQQIPNLPPEGQNAAVPHIINLLSDKDYLDVIPYIQNLRIAPGFHEHIVAESLNRPKEVKLRILLTALRTPQHPMRETAANVLKVLLNQDHGNDYGKWEAAVNEALQQP
jgi:hypothetical protein